MRSGPGEGGGPGDFLAHPTCYIQMGRDRRDREPWPGVNCLNGPRVASKKKLGHMFLGEKSGTRTLNFFLLPSAYLKEERKNGLVWFPFRKPRTQF